MERLLHYFQVHTTWDFTLLAFGLLGQMVFAARFYVQWIVSEKRRESTIPVAFWYLSLLGAVMILVYGLLRGELLLILPQLPASVIYLRNLVLIRRKKRERETHSPPADR